MIAPAPLEDWLRDRYFTATVDISSSGVANYTLGEVLDLAGVPADSLRDLMFRDSHSLGGPELRESLARRFAGGAVDKVMATQGSSEALYLVAHALLGPGDEVVVPSPGYHSPSLLAGAIGFTPKVWELRQRDGFVSNVDELLGLIGPRTRAVVANFPHNPTGATITPEDLAALVDACAAVGAHLFWDAAFAELTYDQEPLPDPALTYDRAISFGTLSKAFGLPGIRVGWCLAAPEVLNTCVRRRDYLSLALSPLVEAVARHAVDHADALLAPRLAQARHNRDLVTAWAASMSTVDYQRPGGGVTAYPRLTSVANIEAFAGALADEHGVLVVPGTAFGQQQHIRLGYGGPTAELETGLARLSAALTH